MAGMSSEDQKGPLSAPSVFVANQIRTCLVVALGQRNIEPSAASLHCEQ
jgi:hypothetical protein